MDSLKTIAYNLLNKLRGGRSSNTEKISLEQLMYNVELYRALLLRRDLINSRDVTEFEQEINIPVEVITLTDNGNVRFMLKSTVDLPKPVRLLFQTPLTIMTNDRTKTIPVVTYKSLPHLAGNRYTANQMRAMLINGKLHIIGDGTTEYIKKVLNNEEAELNTNDILQSVTVNGVFEEPRKIMELNGIDPNETSEQPYPISYDMVQRITESMLRGELQILGQTQDETALTT